ncbi:hypothetical protein [Larkinella punicea]|uniref:Uncharacterized protein n=1 Tax=Larkinella punicea TaxID=2315727 RepID=A0A368JUB0_9BACT|nr:hypothetical protein [Larkinella punicea]RCR71259.1 hypothetical protein DUE52_03145 [Larkinella punicea]
MESQSRTRSSRSIAKIEKKIAELKSNAKFCKQQASFSTSEKEIANENSFTNQMKKALRDAKVLEWVLDENKRWPF